MIFFEQCWDKCFIKNQCQNNFCRWIEAAESILEGYKVTMLLKHPLIKFKFKIRLCKCMNFFWCTLQVFGLHSYFSTNFTLPSLSQLSNWTCHNNRNVLRCTVTNHMWLLRSWNVGTGLIFYFRHIWLFATVYIGQCRFITVILSFMSNSGLSPSKKASPTAQAHSNCLFKKLSSNTHFIQFMLWAWLE